MKQVEEAKERARQLELEKMKPFARNADDTEMNEYLKSQDRWNDPMAQFIKVQSWHGI